MSGDLSRERTCVITCKRLQTLQFQEQGTAPSKAASGFCALGVGDEEAEGIEQQNTAGLVEGAPPTPRHLCQPRRRRAQGASQASCLTLLPRYTNRLLYHARQRPSTPAAQRQRRRHARPEVSSGAPAACCQRPGSDLDARTWLQNSFKIKATLPT
jgi:hypothetical protein